MERKGESKEERRHSIWGGRKGINLVKMEDTHWENAYGLKLLWHL